MRLNVLAFAVTCALVWGVGLFIGTWWIILFEGTSTDPTLLGRIYRGYELTPAGSFIGLIWGLIDGLIGGAIFAALYNWLSRRIGAGG
jgi:hypothetical protein